MWTIAPDGSAVVVEQGTGRVLAIRSGATEVLAAGLQVPVGVAIAPDGAVLVAESGAGRVVTVAGGRAETLVDGLDQPQGLLVRDGRLYIVDSGLKAVVEFDLRSGARQTIASDLPVGAPPGVIPKPLLGMPPFSGPQGPFAGIAAGPDGTLYVSADADGSVLALHPPRAMTATRDPAGADPRYLQVARALRQEIVDGVYPVGSQLPTEHELCERFSVSRYTVREALRRLREDNLIASRPRAGTLVIPRTSSSSYAQDVMSINDLMAFATGARFAIQANRMLTMDADLAARTGLPLGEEWLAVGGFRQVEGAPNPICFTEYYINRAFASVGRILQRHNGPIFPLIEDMFGRSIVEVHQEISAVPMRATSAPGSTSSPVPLPSRSAAPTSPLTGRQRRSPSTPIPAPDSAIR